MPTQLRRVSDETFKTLLKSASSDANATLVVKAQPSLVNPLEGRRLKWLISSEAVDRMGDVIKVAGWKLDNFEKGGSALWAHDPTVLPVAKPIKTWVEDGKLWSIAEYPTRDIYEFGDTVYQLAKNGFLRGSSIGMRPIKYVRDDARVTEEHPFPMMFLEQELLEWSHTPIPANPEALLSAKSLGVNLDPIRTWAEKALDECIEVNGVSRTVIERAYNIASGERVNMLIESKNVEIEVETKAEDPAAPGSAGAPVDSDPTYECNDMLDKMLGMKEAFQAAQDAGSLDASKMNALMEMLQALAAPEPVETMAMPNVESTETKPVEQKTESENTTKAAPHGTEATEAKSHLDWSDDDIRGLVRELRSAGLVKRKR